MTSFPGHLFKASRGGPRRRRLAKARSLGVEQLDQRQMLSANAMASFAVAGYGLAHDIRPVLPKAEYVCTSARGKIAPQAAKVQQAAVAAKPTVSFSNGVLAVTGTSDADSVEVRQTGDRIEIIGATASQRLPQIWEGMNPFTVKDGTASIPASMVKQIKINSGAGNDTIMVRMYEMSPDVIRNVSIDAGAGNDTVFVGVDGTMAKKVFADLGKGTDALEVPKNRLWKPGGPDFKYVTLGAQQRAETVNYGSDYVQQYRTGTLRTMNGFEQGLVVGLLRGKMELQIG